jgi:hypothetical protein
MNEEVAVALLAVAPPAVAAVAPVAPRETCFICEPPRQVPRRLLSHLRELGWICSNHLPKKFPGTYKAKCSTGDRCSVRTGRTGYTMTSDFYNHLLIVEHTSPRDAYEIVMREVRTANERIAAEQIAIAAEQIAPKAEQIAIAAEQIAPEAGQIAPPAEQIVIAAEQIAPADEEIALADEDVIKRFWVKVRPFLTRHRSFEGAFTSAAYMKKLAEKLRGDQVSNIVDDVFSVRGGIDMYTGCDRTLLLALDNAYEDNNEEMNENKDHPAFAKRTLKDERRFFEVDHIFDIQLWVRAILVANSCIDDDHQFVGTLTFNHLEYLRTIINDPENLNVTPWKVNSAKGKLLTNFLSKWQFSNEGITPCSATNLLAIEVRGSQTRRILQNDLIVNEELTKIDQRLCRLMRRTLVEFIAPKLELSEGVEWLKSEREYLRKLLSVLKHMCLSLWPIEVYDLETDE